MKKQYDFKKARHRLAKQLPALHKETNRRFWEQTDYKPGQRLDPAIPADKAMMPVWMAIFRKVSREVDNVGRLEGRGDQEMHPRIVNISFDVTQEVATALRALRDTGLFGNGVDCASISEELLRRALLDPDVIYYWRKP